ncbi:hypothetical protein ACFWP3_17420 [Streptomyces sp. NPDC058525]|uniref:hypothetical protein n=1 Tax=Streptomyces sp. NPDC058525 TaxID=3346538 RepID=UPI00364624DA
MTYGERSLERRVEGRLRAALDARAAGITVRELRPADPPGPHVRRFPALRLRRLGLPLAGLAAAAAAVVGYLVLAPDPAPVRPVPPAAPPEIGPPTPTPTPSSPAPSVSPGAGSEPGPDPSASPSEVPDPAKSGPSRPAGGPLPPSKSATPSATQPTPSRPVPSSVSPSPTRP